MNTATPPQPVKLFYSYSHSDEAFRKELEKHLSLTRRNRALARVRVRVEHAIDGIRHALCERYVTQRASGVLR